MSVQLYQASSLASMLSGNGESYFFDGKHLFIKMTDPGKVAWEGYQGGMVG